MTGQAGPETPTYRRRARDLFLTCVRMLSAPACACVRGREISDASRAMETRQAGPICLFGRCIPITQPSTRQTPDAQLDLCDEAMNERANEWTCGWAAGEEETVSSHAQVTRPQAGLVAQACTRDPSIGAGGRGGSPLPHFTGERAAPPGSPPLTEAVLTLRDRQRDTQEARKTPSFLAALQRAGICSMGYRARSLELVLRPAAGLCPWANRTS